MSGIREHATCRSLMQRCSVIQYLHVVLGVHRGGGRRLFALISHKRKTVVYILNTLIPWSTSPLPCSFHAPGALITVGNDAVILRGGWWVGGRVRAREADGKTDRKKEREIAREGEGEKIMVVSVFPSRCLWHFFPHPLSLWTVGILQLSLGSYCRLLCAADEIAYECIMIQRWVSLCVWK